MLLKAVYHSTISGSLLLRHGVWGHALLENNVLDFGAL